MEVGRPSHSTFVAPLIWDGLVRDSIALNSIIVTPYLTPAVAELMTGLDPNCDAFKSSQLTLLQNLLESLAPSASGGDVDPGDV